jgi:hypothetical protein
VIPAEQTMTRFKWGHWPDPFTLCRCNYPTCSVERMCFVVWRAFCWNCFLGNDDFSKPLYPKLRRPYTPNLCSILNSNHSFKQSTWWSGHGNLPMSSWQCGLADLATWSSVDLGTWTWQSGVDKPTMWTWQRGVDKPTMWTWQHGVDNPTMWTLQFSKANWYSHLGINSQI